MCHILKEPLCLIEDERVFFVACYGSATEFKKVVPAHFFFQIISR